MIVRVKSSLDAELEQLHTLGPGVWHQLVGVESMRYRVRVDRRVILFDQGLFEDGAAGSQQIVRAKAHLDWELAKLEQLGRGNRYAVLAIESGLLRIHGDSGPCLYPPLLFTFADEAWPQAWVTHGDPWRDGVAGWPELIAPGFMERWHDGDTEAVELYQRVLRGVRREIT